MRLSDRLISSPLRKLLLAVGLASAAILGVALVSQYGFGLYPCELCLYQRYPYAAILAVAFVMLLWSRASARMVRGAVLLCAALLAVDAGIAGYHAGVETGMFKGPDACSSGTKTNQSIEELRAEIMGAPLVSCSQAMVHVLGLSMAAWNMIAALVLLIGVLAVYWQLLRQGRAQ